MGFADLRIWPIFGVFSTRFAGFLQFCLWFPVFVNNDGSFCAVHFTVFLGFGKDPAVFLKPVLFQGTTYIALHSFFRGIDDKSSLFSTHHFGRNGEGHDNIKAKDFLKYHTAGIISCGLVKGIREPHEVKKKFF